MKQIDWKDFAEKLNVEHGSVHTIDDDNVIPNPCPDDSKYWLQDVTVGEIVDFVKEYFEPEPNDKENKFADNLSTLDADELRKLIFEFWKRLKEEGEYDMLMDKNFGISYAIGSAKMIKVNYLSAMVLKMRNEKELKCE